MHNDQRNLETIPAGTLGIIPVSYTHLDVYKRQHQCRSVPVCRVQRTT